MQKGRLRDISSRERAYGFRNTLTILGLWRRLVTESVLSEALDSVFG